jgi:hypothetical protein
MQTTYNKQAKVSNSNKEQLTPEQAAAFHAKLQYIKRAYRATQEAARATLPDTSSNTL